MKNWVQGSLTLALGLSINMWSLPSLAQEVCQGSKAFEKYQRTKSNYKRLHRADVYRMSLSSLSALGLASLAYGVDQNVMRQKQIFKTLVRNKHLLGEGQEQSLLLLQAKYEIRDSAKILKKQSNILKALAAITAIAGTTYGLYKGAELHLSLKDLTQKLRSTMAEEFNLLGQGSQVPAGELWAKYSIEDFYRLDDKTACGYIKADTSGALEEQFDLISAGLYAYENPEVFESEVEPLLSSSSPAKDIGLATETKVSLASTKSVSDSKAQK